MRTPSNSPRLSRQQPLLPSTTNIHQVIMKPSSKAQQPLTERSTNLPSPVKSPSKIPLPPSPQKSSKETVTLAAFAEETGPMDGIFKASSLSQKPEFIRKISEAHSAGQTYVSPSDEILSPTTKKLSEVKGRRFGNFRKSSSLYRSSNIFAKPATSSKEGGKDHDQGRRWEVC